MTNIPQEGYGFNESRPAIFNLKYIINELGIGLIDNEKLKIHQHIDSVSKYLDNEETVRLEIDCTILFNTLCESSRRILTMRMLNSKTYLYSKVADEISDFIKINRLNETEKFTALELLASGKVSTPKEAFKEGIIYKNLQLCQHSEDITKKAIKLIDTSSIKDKMLPSVAIKNVGLTPEILTLGLSTNDKKEDYLFETADFIQHLNQDLIFQTTLSKVGIILAPGFLAHIDKVSGLISNLQQLSEEKEAYKLLSGLSEQYEIYIRKYMKRHGIQLFGAVYQEISCLYKINKLNDFYKSFCEKLLFTGKADSPEDALDETNIYQSILIYCHSHEKNEKNNKYYLALDTIQQKLKTPNEAIKFLNINKTSLLGNLTKFN